MFFSKDEKWSKEFDPKLQALLSDLEAGLGSVLRRPLSSRDGSKSGEGDSLQGLCALHLFIYFVKKILRR